MRVHVFHLFFRPVDGIALAPVDPELFAMTMKFVNDTMVEPRPDLTTYPHTWVACEVDEEGKPMQAVGVLCMMMRPDFPVCHFTDCSAVLKLVQRANDHLHDVYGMRGAYGLVHIAKDAAEETRCPNYLDWMKRFEMTPADRWAMKVR